MDEKPFDTMNVIPFVDVMFVLLAIVLTTATFITSGRLPIDLPRASASPAPKQESRVIELAANGATYLDGQACAPEELPARLAGLPPTTAILIRADRSLALERFVAVADVLKRLNFAKVGLETQSRASGAAQQAR